MAKRRVAKDERMGLIGRMRLMGRGESPISRMSPISPIRDPIQRVRPGIRACNFAPLPLPEIVWRIMFSHTGMPW
jgi:hypothetical protein